MTRDTPVDFGLGDELDFPLDWEIFSRGAENPPNAAPADPGWPEPTCRN